MAAINELCAIALQTDKEVRAYNLKIEFVSAVIDHWCAEHS
jgi:hypothetical protein